MKMICPKCNTKGELTQVGEDVVFHCPACGIFRDMILECPEKGKSPGKGKWLESQEGKEVIKDMLQKGESITSICNQIGISRPTMYRRAERDPELASIMGMTEQQEG